MTYIVQQCVRVCVVWVLGMCLRTVAYVPCVCVSQCVFVCVCVGRCAEY